MKPQIILALFVATATLQCFAQNTNKSDKLYACENGRVHFFASSPIVNANAVSDHAVCLINTGNKTVSAKVAMQTFEFKQKKMQSDFNEDYIESDKYPYASLEAVIVDNIDFAKDGIYDVTLKGTFEVHGVKRETEIKGKLTIKNGQPVNATAEFNVALADYHIKLPTLLMLKLNKIVKVDVNFDLKKYQGNI